MKNININTIELIILKQKKFQKLLNKIDEKILKEYFFLKSICIDESNLINFYKKILKLIKSNKNVFEEELKNIGYFIEQNNNKFIFNEKANVKDTKTIEIPKILKKFPNLSISRNQNNILFLFWK